MTFLDTVIDLQKKMKYPTATRLINISADNQKHSRCHMKCWNLGFFPGGPPEFQNWGTCLSQGKARWGGVRSTLPTMNHSIFWKFSWKCEFWFLTFAFISTLAKQSKISFHDAALFSCFLRIESTWVQQNNVFSYIILKNIYFLKNEIFKKYSTKFHLSTAHGNFRKNDLSVHSNWRTKNMKYHTAKCLINISVDHQKHSRCHMKCWNLGFCPGGPPEF